MHAWYLKITIEWRLSPPAGLIYSQSWSYHWHLWGSDSGNTNLLRGHNLKKPEHRRSLGCCRPADGGAMSANLAGRLENSKVTQDLVRVHLAFQCHWGKANVAISEVRFLGADWQRQWLIRMDEVGHMGGPGQQISTNQWRNILVF